MAWTRFCAPGRWDQGLRWMKARPELWPRPPKLKPGHREDAVDVVPFLVLKIFADLIEHLSAVRPTVAPTGVFTCTKRKPWSSSGRNDVGTRT